MTDQTRFAALASKIAADLARRGIRAHSVLRLRQVSLAQIGCTPEGHLIEALLGLPGITAQASWLDVEGDMLALESEPGRSLLAHAFDARRIPGSGRREAALLDWLALLIALPGSGPSDQNGRPFRLWRSDADLALLHPPGIAPLRITFLPARVRLENSGVYEVDCMLSHGDHLFRTTIACAPGQAPEMMRADLLAGLPPSRLGFGPNGWLIETARQQEPSHG